MTLTDHGKRGRDLTLQDCIYKFSVMCLTQESDEFPCHFYGVTSFPFTDDLNVCEYTRVYLCVRFTSSMTI